MFKHGFAKKAYIEKHENNIISVDFCFQIQKEVGLILSPSSSQLKKKPLLIVLTARNIFALSTSLKNNVSKIYYHQYMAV